MLDPLDEIQDSRTRTEVIKHITTSVGPGLANLHVLATSRDELDIRESFESISNSGIPIENSKVDSDIRKYVSSCLQEWPRPLNGDIQFLIQEKLGERAHGM